MLCQRPAIPFLRKQSGQRTCEASVPNNTLLWHTTSGEEHTCCKVKIDTREVCFNQTKMYLYIDLSFCRLFLRNHLWSLNREIDFGDLPSKQLFLYRLERTCTIVRLALLNVRKYPILVVKLGILTFAGQRIDGVGCTEYYAYSPHRKGQRFFAGIGIQVWRSWFSLCYYRPLWENYYLASTRLTRQGACGNYLSLEKSYIILRRKQGKFNEATKQLLPLMQTIGKPTTSGTSWRTNRDLFVPSKTGDVEPGCLDISPSWFAQGHEVRLWLGTNIWLFSDFFFQTTRDQKIHCCHHEQWRTHAFQNG